MLKILNHEKYTELNEDNIDEFEKIKRKNKHHLS